MIEHIFDTTEKKPSEKLDALPNVALPNAEQTAESKRLASNLRHLLSKLGAKPKKLKEAASKIAVEVQKAILADLRLRHKEIEHARNASQLYRRFALGILDEGPQNAGNGHDPPAA